MIAAGTHPKDDRATYSQGPFRNSNRHAEVRYVQWPMQTGRQCILEASHNAPAILFCGCVVVYLVGSQTIDERVSQVLLQSSNDLPMRECFGRCLGKVA